MARWRRRKIKEENKNVMYTRAHTILTEKPRQTLRHARVVDRFRASIDYYRSRSSGASRLSLVLVRLLYRSETPKSKAEHNTYNVCVCVCATIDFSVNFRNFFLLFYFYSIYLSYNFTIIFADMLLLLLVLLMCVGIYLWFRWNICIYIKKKGVR